MNVRRSILRGRGFGPGPVWALAAALALPWAARAETLADAWAMALHHDGSVAAMQSYTRAAQADRTAAERQRWPALDVGGAYTQLNQAPILDITTPAGNLKSPKIWRHDAFATATADLSVPLWTSGRIKGSIGAARAGASGAAAQEAMSSADVKLAVAEAYVGVFRARAALAVANSGLASLKAHASDVQQMYDKQAVAKADLLAAEVALANATESQLRAENALNVATAAYNRWVGEPMDRVPDLAEPAPAAATAGESFDAMVARAILRRPELAALRAQREGYDAAAREARAQALPQVSLHAGYNHFDNQILDRQNFASVGVSFQWRLFDSGQVRNRTAALNERAHAVSQQLDDMRSKVALEVRTSVLDRDDAAAREHAAAVAVTQAEENVRVADELYRSGLGTNTQVLDAETLRATALTNRDTARYDLVIAGYRLERALGEL